MGPLVQRRALVTGSTSGIGLVIAKALVAQKYSLMIHGRVARDSDGEEICARLADSAPDNNKNIKISFDGADMRDVGQIERLMHKCDDVFGGLDVLINNAGVQHVAGIQDFPDQKWDEIIAVNLSAYFHTAKLALPGMINRGYGRIINVSSTQGIVGSVKKSAYVASKHGVIGLTKVIALETAPYDITCNALCPGFVMTPLVKEQIELKMAEQKNVNFAQAEHDFIVDKHPNGRFVQAEELANVVMMLIDTPSMTGANIVVDGGWTAQ